MFGSNTQKVCGHLKKKIEESLVKTYDKFQGNLFGMKDFKIKCPLHFKVSTCKIKFTF